MSTANRKGFQSVLVLDMQPIDPPTGGGRLRLLGLYHRLGSDMPTTYVGTYDWPGETYRQHKLSETLREIDVPLSDQHFSMNERWSRLVHGKTIIDSTFHLLAELSPDYVSKARQELSKADVVFFSHPWIYPIVRDLVDTERQLIIYDAHNVEGYLRVQLLDDGGLGTEIAREVVRIEYQLCQEADLVLACSQEDAQRFHQLYNIPFRKIKKIPNGVFAEKIVPVPIGSKRKLQNKLGLVGKFIAIFIGSSYQPNIDAVDFIINAIAPKLPEVHFLVCGSVCDAILAMSDTPPESKNVELLGLVSEDEKIDYLHASDLALNPMLSGSGTNIKMFDYFAAGLPTISTPIGARGIAQPNDQSFVVCSEEEFVPWIKQIVDEDELSTLLACNARSLVKEKYAWERISAELGILVKRWHRLKGRQPFFSVIIPTYERHDKLSTLMGHLTKQICKDFEVIVVDQSQQPWPDREVDFHLNLLYIHTDIKGAVKARNTGSHYATGKVLAFTDDDCEPQQDWLFNARQYFEQKQVIGIEGLIKSDRIGDPAFRTVTNEDFQNIGFMTANLFIQTEIFNTIDGFDERFDNPHFREDTDLGWRALAYGEIPFAEDVRVFHPPHKRHSERESLQERNKFFEKDVLLMQKHPDRYQELFHAERHWEITPGFCEYLLKGAEKYGVEIPEWCANILEAQKGKTE